MLVCDVKVGRVGKSDVLAYIIRRYQTLSDEEKEEDKKLNEQLLKELETPKRKVFFIEGHF